MCAILGRTGTDKYLGVVDIIVESIKDSRIFGRLKYYPDFPVTDASTTFAPVAM